MAHELGDDVIVPIKFRNKKTKVLGDPTAWQVRLKPPKLDELPVLVFGVDAELTKDADGEFEMLVSTDRNTAEHAGRWTYWVTSTGVNKGSQSGHFVVDDPVLPV